RGSLPQRTLPALQLTTVRCGRVPAAPALRVRPAAPCHPPGRCPSYLPSATRMTWPPSGAAVTPPSAAFSTMTATTTVGLPAGANPTNQPCGASPGRFSAVPVFPATSTPGIFAPNAKAPGPETAPTSMVVEVVAVAA